MTKQYQLNAAAIKKAMTINGIKVHSCKKSSGSSRKAILITIAHKDYDLAKSFFNELGIVGSTGRQLGTNGVNINGKTSFLNAYMSEDMYNELNS